MIEYNLGGFMDKKVLINIVSINTKIVVLSSLVSMSIDFVETYNEDDLKFKCKLLKNEIVVYIHELNYNEYNKDFLMIKELNAKNIKVIILIDKYNSQVIDDAMKAGVNDILTLPLKEKIFINKLKPFLAGKITKNLKTQSNNKMIDNKNNSILVHKEIVRADRGKYSVCIILVELVNMQKSEIDNYCNDLEIKLRTTDIISKCQKNRLLLICPFTKKKDIVQVENKVRNMFEEYYKKSKHKIGLFIYGVSYPEDSDDLEKLFKRLEDGIHNSMIIGNMRGTFNEISRDKIENYRKMLRRY